MIRTILFPTDLSKNAEQAFSFACALARDLGAALLVLHVYPPPIDHSDEAARRQPPTYEETLAASAGIYSARFAGGSLASTRGRKHGRQNLARGEFGKL